MVISSSGAAYGYHADNAPWLNESHPLRGNDEFAYSRHKRLVEEELARLRTEHPELRQTIFRIGTILGERVRNQITALFDAPRLLRVAGSESPFVFIWDQDVADAMAQAVITGRSGIFNVAGDGALTVREIAGLHGETDTDGTRSAAGRRSLAGAEAEAHRARSGAAAVPALPSGAGQHGPETGVRLHSHANQPGSVPGVPESAGGRRRPATMTSPLPAALDCAAGSGSPEGLEVAHTIGLEGQSQPSGHFRHNLGAEEVPL